MFELTEKPDEEELDEEELADLQRRSAMARQIEAAFASREYPGDTHIVADAEDWESPEILEGLQGKAWDELSVATLFEQRLCLWMLTPEAFQYYLPAFIRAALLYPDQVDTLTEYTLFVLAPPAEEAEERKQRWFTCRVEGFDAAQKAAITEFVKLFVETETSYPDPDRDRTAAFWLGNA